VSLPGTPADDAEARASTRPAPAIADVVLAVVCVGAVAFFLAELCTFGYGRDQGIYAMVARAILAGKMPYRDAWDFKPPGIFVIYALSRALLGRAEVGIRLVEALGLAATALAMVRLSGAWWGDRRIGLLGGVVAVIAHVQLDFWHTAQPESFGGMLTIFALLALGPLLSGTALSTGARLRDRDARRRLVLAGVLFGCAGLLKPPLAGGGAVVAAALGLRVLEAQGGITRRSLGAAIRPAAMILAGGAAPFVVCLAWFAARGALGSLWEVLFVFTPRYTALGWVGETTSGMAYWGFTEWLCTYSSLATVGFLLCLGFPRAPRERFGVRLIGAIIALHVVGVTMQGKFFPYHYGATWPLTGLLAGLGFFRLWERLAPRGPAGVAAFFALFVIAGLGRSALKDTELSFYQRTLQRISIFTSSPRDQAALDRLASVADVNAGANREVAALLHARVPEGRAVFVWGFEPVIYDWADRSPATRYLYDVPQRVAWAKDEARSALMRDLEAGRPAAIVVEHRDVFPMVTGDAIDSADTLKGFEALSGLLQSRYALETTIEDFDIYLERP
jgi:hypothetical protein